MARNNGPGLYEFLMEAELQQYYPGIRGIVYSFYFSSCSFKYALKTLGMKNSRVILLSHRLQSMHLKKLD